MERSELYGNQELTEAKLRRRRAVKRMCVIGAIGLAACVLLCVFTTRRNQGTMLPIVIGVSIAAGWAVIFLSHTAYGESRAAERHDELMLTGERERTEGTFVKTDEVTHVRNGVAVRKVRSEQNGRELVFRVAETKAAALPDAFTGAIETVYDFIAAYEVRNDVEKDPS